jgi:peroxiredoxin
MRRVRKGTALGLGALATGLLVVAASTAQEPKTDRRLDSIEAIDKAAAEQHKQAETRRIEDLAGLAASQSGEEAEHTYKHLFSLAIVEGRVEPAESAAETYLKREGGDPKTRALAAFVDVMSAASRGENDAAIEDLKRFVSGGSKVEPETLYGLGETFLQRLNAEGQTDQTQAVARLFAEGPFDKEVQQHFANRLERLQLIGKPAPTIDAQDIDGDAVRLNDLKGRVVLVEFWATWCPPCLAAIPELNDLYERFRDKDFEIIGVSTDALREGNNPDQARSTIRQIVVDAYIPWRVVLDRQGQTSLASKFGVTEVPAGFLIDQDGQIVRVDLRGQDLNQAVAKLLGIEPEVDAAQAGTKPGSAPVSGGTPVRKPR